MLWERYFVIWGITRATLGSEISLQNDVCRHTECKITKKAEDFSTEKRHKVWTGCVAGWLWFNVIFSDISDSDGTVVEFRNLDLLPGTERHGQLGYLGCRTYPVMGTGTSEDPLVIKRPIRGYFENRTRNSRSAVQPTTSTPMRWATKYRKNLVGSSSANVVLIYNWIS